MRTTICCCVVALVVGCDNPQSPPVSSTARRPGTADHDFPNPGGEKSDIKVVTGTSFLFAGPRCQLLGVTEHDDPKVRERARMFAERWFRSIGNYIGVYNSSNPICLKDGTCLVWVTGYDSYLSCLNLEVVRAGLVKVDYFEQEGYTFLTPGKDRDYLEKWQQGLREAENDHRKGVKPQVLFDWYETDSGSDTK